MKTTKDNNRRPSWERWRAMPTLKLWEAVALSLDIEPDVVKTERDAWMGALHPFYEGDDFRDRLEILRANLTDGGYTSPQSHYHPHVNWWLEPLRTENLVKWVIKIARWEIPDEMKAMAKKDPLPKAEPAFGIKSNTSVPADTIPYTVVEAGLHADERFCKLALRVLRAEAIGLSFSPATAAVGLLNHWFRNRDLTCYMQGKSVDDPSLLQLSAVEGDDGAGHYALEEWMHISKRELLALLTRRKFPLPAFLTGETTSSNVTTSQAQAANTMVSSAQRRTSLDAAIDLAIGRANSLRLVPVWSQLSALALASHAPFTGVSARDALEYATEKNQTAFFSKNALDHRLRNRRKLIG